MLESATFRLKRGQDRHAVDGRLHFGTLSSKWHGPTVAGELPNMTLVFERREARNPLHVLIIAVGRFAEGQLDDVPGAAASGERAATFWRDQRLRVPNHEVGTVEFLASPAETPLGMTGLGGGEIERATFANVRDAFDRWVDRCAAHPSSGAVLHWIGHGTDEFGPSDAQSTRYLFCEDYDAAHHRQHAVLLSATVELLKRIDFSRRALLFIDTCRDANDVDPLPDYPAALSNSPALILDLDVKNRVACYGLRYPGDRTRSYPSPRPDCGFRGGTLFTEAVLDAIGVFGAECSTPGGLWFSMTNTLPDAINARLDMWRDHLGHDNVLGAGLSANIRAPIAEVQSPAAMVKVDLHEQASNDAVPSHIDLIRINSGSFPLPNALFMPAVLRRLEEAKIWRGDIPAGWWKPNLSTIPERPPFKALPPKRDEHWIV